jgi:hypothetical protein
VVAGAGAPSCPKCHKLELIRLLLLRAFSDMDDANPTNEVSVRVCSVISKLGWIDGDCGGIILSQNLWRIKSGSIYLKSPPHGNN